MSFTQKPTWMSDVWQLVFVLKGSFSRQQTIQDCDERSKTSKLVVSTRKAHILNLPNILLLQFLVPDSFNFVLAEKRVCEIPTQLIRLQLSDLFSLNWKKSKFKWIWTQDLYEIVHLAWQPSVKLALFKQFLVKAGIKPVTSQIFFEWLGNH